MFRKRAPQPKEAFEQPVSDESQAQITEEETELHLPPYTREETTQPGWRPAPNPSIISKEWR